MVEKRLVTDFENCYLTEDDKTALLNILLHHGLSKSDATNRINSLEEQQNNIRKH